MIAHDVILQLAAKLPQLTDYFTSNASVVSLTRVGTTVTVVTDVPHQLSIGMGASILGAQTPILITSFTRVGSIGFIEFAENCDFTLGPEIKLTNPQCEVQGSVEVEFNGSFLITAVTNRRNIQVDMDDSGPTVATGSPQGDNAASILQQYNGIHLVTDVVDTTTFEFETTLTGLDPVGSMEIRSNARISGSVSYERALDSYTEHSLDQLWLFVVLEDAVASKDRKILSDATDNIQRSNYFRQQIVDQVSLYLFIPSSQEIAARNARDLSQQLLSPICGSILFKRFNTQLFVGEYNPLQFLSHGFEDYNTAFYVHRYTFEQVADLLFEDTVGYDEDVAFRDIDLDIGLDVGTGILTATIDLDESPLP